MMEKDNLPKDWTVASLGEICEMYQPKTISTKQLDPSGQYLVYGANGIIGKYDQYNHEHSELLITCRGASCGNVNISKPFSWINGNAMVVRPKEKGLLLLKFLELYFRGGFDVKKAISGSAQPQITRASLNPIEIPLPPLPEQHRIVTKLEELLTELDKGIEQLQTAQQQLKIYRQAVLKWAFEGKLTNDNKYPIVSLSEAIEQPKYGTSKKCDYNISGKGVLRIPNIGDGVIDVGDLKFAAFDKNEIDTYSLRNGDILTIRSNGSVDLVGKCALITDKDKDFLYAGYLIRLRPIAEKVVPKYLLHALSSHELRIQIESKAKSSSGVNNINSEELKALHIPLPSKKQQLNILSAIESRLSVCDKIEETIENSLQQSEALRLSIIKKAFEGKLVPQDPNDEPAGELLERIRKMSESGWAGLKDTQDSEKKRKKANSKIKYAKSK